MSTLEKFLIKLSFSWNRGRYDTAYEVRALIIHFSEQSIKLSIKCFVPGKIVQNFRPFPSLGDRYNLIVYVQDVSRVKCLLFKWHEMTTLCVVEAWDKVLSRLLKTKDDEVLVFGELLELSRVKHDVVPVLFCHSKEAFKLDFSRKSIVEIKLRSHLISAFSWTLNDESSNWIRSSAFRFATFQMFSDILIVFLT